MTKYGYECKTRDKGCGFIAFDGMTCLKGSHCYNRIRYKLVKQSLAQNKSKGG